MQRVLVTAGSGSIGKAVVKTLVAKGFEVVILDTRPSPEASKSCLQILGRSTDPDLHAMAANGCSHIVHLEWSGSVHRTTLEPVQTNQHNTAATLLALETARRLQIPLTFASTSVYRGDLNAPVKEEQEKNERSLYVVQKLYAESCVRAYALMFGISTCSLRVFNVYGSEGAPFQIIPRIRAAINSGNPIQLTGDGGQMRDFIHVEDVAAAFVSTLDKQFKGEAINVGTGRGTSMLELAQMAMNISGKELPIDFVPAKGEEARYLIADVGRATEMLEFRAQISLEEGLRRTLI